ncbi:MAG TPA: response regulator [Candidatus Eremiobacteraeota bacterium]|nr:MAG: Response regulator MprA [bacterium ADurb.Bin363]HPZ09084.1 response regulator [Candidatus Eremiobacteraeota bacterium]
MTVILVIDDDEIIRKLIKFTLEKRDYKVITAEDALEGICKLELNPDLIILDIVMPEIDGYEVLNLIKKDSQFKDIPVIMLTSKHDINHMLKAFSCGAEDYLAKPFEIDELIARIRNLLRIKEIQKKILVAERMAAIGQVALTLRHEINNPLTAVIGQTELVLRKEENLSFEIKEKLQYIYEQGQVIESIISKLEKI